MLRIEFWRSSKGGGAPSFEFRGKDSSAEEQVLFGFVPERSQWHQFFASVIGLLDMKMLTSLAWPTKQYGVEVVKSRVLFGSTHFSICDPEAKSFRSARERGAQEHKAFLLEPKRLDARLEIFSKLTVPILAKAAQALKLKHFVAVGNCLPRQVTHHLQQLAEEHGFLEVQIVDSQTEAWHFGHPKRMFGRHHEELDLGRPTIVGQYNVDDDDVPSLFLFEFLWKYLKSEFVGATISPSRGIIAVWDAGAFLAPMRQVYKPFINIGRMKVHLIDGDNQILSRFDDLDPAPWPRFGHDFEATRVPVVVDGRIPTWIWTRSAGNDSRQDGGDWSKALSEISKSLEKFSPVSTQEVEELFGPTVAARLRSA